MDRTLQRFAWLFGMQATMKRIELVEQSESAASPPEIYALLKNSSTYPDWSMVDSYKMERPGKNESHDIGEIRVLTTGPFVMLEEMTEFDPNRCVAYRLLSGFPLSDYRARTLLEALPEGGTRILWQSSFYPKYGGTAWFWRFLMRHILRRFVRDLARAAEAGESRASTEQVE